MLNLLLPVFKRQPASYLGVRVYSKGIYKLLCMDENDLAKSAIDYISDIRRKQLILDDILSRVTMRPYARYRNTALANLQHIARCNSNRMVDISDILVAE
jgi:hypothetical protein